MSEGHYFRHKITEMGHKTAENWEHNGTTARPNGGDTQTTVEIHTKVINIALAYFNLKRSYEYMSSQT